MIRLRLLGYKGYFVLSHILDYLEFIDDVVVGEDKNVKNDYALEIEQICKKHNIKYSYRDNELEYKSKYSVTIGWRWLVHKDEKIIVFHDSMLPKYRGFNPLVSALINGDNSVGVTSLFGEKEYDAGPIIGQYSLEIKYPAKINDVIKDVSSLYLQLMIDILDQIKKGNYEIKAQVQDKKKVSYSLWRDEDDYFINWNLDAISILRHIHAVGYPYTGAKTKIGDQIYIIQDASIVNDVHIVNRTVGKVIFKDEEGLSIVCGKGLLKIKELYTEEGISLDYTKLFRLKLHK